MIPPPPPISPDMLEDDEALGSMLISWYMSGYHTGYYLVSNDSIQYIHGTEWKLCEFSQKNSFPCKAGSYHGV